MKDDSPFRHTLAGFAPTLAIGLDLRFPYQLWEAAGFLFDKPGFSIIIIELDNVN